MFKIKIEAIGLSISNLKLFKSAVALGFAFESVSMYEFVLESKTASKIEHIKEMKSAMKR